MVRPDMSEKPRKIGKAERAAREAIVATCREMNRLGINQGTSGNVSLRHGGLILITPTSLPYDEMEAADIVRLGPDGTSEGRHRPSSEWRFHRDIMAARPEVGAIVHAHPTYSTILAIMGRAIPAVHYMIAAAGGPTIRVAPYALYGTEELSRHAVAALADRQACLLDHHGAIAVAGTLRRALWLLVEVENLARQYHGCLQIGTPPLLSDAQIAEVQAKMGGYGVRD
jgi:L-fuculose-phosphate aldolase